MIEGLDPALVQTLIDSLKEAYGMGGWLAVVPVALVAVVNIYKLPFLQNLLPEKIRWDRLRTSAQLGIVFVVALAGGIATNLLGGSGLVAAIITAVGGAIAAALGHTFVLKPFAKATAAAASYVPSPIVRSLSLVVPYKADELDAAKAAREAAK